VANEAVIIELLGNGGDPISYTCASGTAIVKGTLMELQDPRTAIKVTGAGVAIAGIAAQSKSASDGTTKIAVYTNGIFDMDVIAGGSATLGLGVRSAGATNEITLCTTLDQENGKEVGRSLETGAAAEKIAVRIKL
jgi:hypothetical protein